MERRYFLFKNGHIEETDKVKKHNDNKLYFHKSPKNFLELNDELKKLSYLCDGVYVSFSDLNMEIILFKRDSLDLFTKLHLSSTPCLLEMNDRLREFLFSLVEE